jgi:hypothetical protein
LGIPCSGFDIPFSTSPCPPPSSAIHFFLFFLSTLPASASLLL